MLLCTLVQQILTWMKMLARMLVHLQKPTFSVWEISYWEYVFHTFDGCIEG